MSQPDGENSVRDVVVAAWIDVLGVPDVRPDDNFFLVGGDSLTAVVLAERIESDLPIEFPLATFFRGGLLGELVDECERLTAAVR